jgi:hypothetical protein
MMKIDEKMNLVLEIEQETGEKAADGKTLITRKLYSHSAPIEEATYERYFLLLGEVIATVYAKGFGVGMAGRQALLLVKKLAMDEGGEEAFKDVQAGLINEIERRSNVVVLDPAGGGWKPMPLRVAADSGIITQGEYKEVMSQATFFTAVSWIQTAKEQRAYRGPMERFYSAQIVSLNATAFASSLQTVTLAASTPAVPLAPASQDLV